MDVRRLQERLAPAPGPGGHVVGRLARQLGLAVAHRLDGHADIGYVGKGEAEEDIHIEVGLAGLPGQRALHQVHPGRSAGPLQHRRGEDRHLHRDRGGLVVAADGADQHARCALALQVGVVVREVLHRERHVGSGQKFLVLVAVRIEGADDEGLASHHRPHPPRDVGLGLGHPAHAHGAVQCEIDAVPLAAGLQFGDLTAEEMLVGILGDPARAGPGLGPQRRFDADQLDAVMFARHLHEAAHVGARIEGEQRLALGRRALVDEVLARGIVRQERHRLVGEHSARQCGSACGSWACSTREEPNGKPRHRRRRPHLRAARSLERICRQALSRPHHPRRARSGRPRLDLDQRQDPTQPAPRRGLRAVGHGRSQ